MQIRPERLGDAQAIATLTSQAFPEAAHSDGNEADVVDALRTAGALTISLVALAEDGAIIGHIAFSPVEMTGPAGDWFALGPVSVAPRLQRQGIGSALIRQGLAQLVGLGASGCVLTGDPAYYCRFGFAAHEGFTCYGHASPYLQGLAFDRTPVIGDIRFHPAFGVGR